MSAVELIGPVEQHTGTRGHNARLLEEHGRLYGELRFTIVFTVGIAADEHGSYKQVRDHWTRTWPLADGRQGVAVLRGRGLTRNPSVVLRASRLLGVDVDGEPGRALIRELVPERLPDTVAVRSGRTDGGVHLWYRPPANAPKLKVQFAERLTLSNDGYLLVPPAWHAEAERRYEFIEGHSPWERKIAPFPQQLLDRLLAHKASNDTARRADDSSPVQQGDRHAHLLSLAGLMRYGGCGEETIVAALLAENERRCTPPKPERDVRELGAARQPARARAALGRGNRARPEGARRL